MILDTTSKTIEVILGANITTNQLEITADWVDTQGGSTFAPGGTSLLTNGNTAVTAVSSPAASTQRQVKALTIYNADTVNAAVTVRMFDGTNRRRHVVVTLTPGQSLVFTPEEGWAVLASTNGQIPGTATNDNAAAGNVGEYISSTVTSGSAVSLISGTPKTITSIIITPGDWDVTATFANNPAGTTQFQGIAGSISLVNNTLDTTPGNLTDQNFSSLVPSFGPISAIGPVRYSFNTNTTVYLVGDASFTVSTNSGYGIIQARRVR